MSILTPYHLVNIFRLSIFTPCFMTTTDLLGARRSCGQYARRKCFAILDLFGPNSLFITTTPDDECSFRVRLYTKPQNWVSVQNLSYTQTLSILSTVLQVLKHFHWCTNTLHLLFPFFIKHDLPSLKCSDEDCVANFLLRRDARMSNPGACSLEFQMSCRYWLSVCLSGTIKHSHLKEKAYWVR